MSNLRQLVAAAKAYEADYGSLPIWSGSGHKLLDGKLASYGVTRELGICPSDSGPHESGSGPYSYGNTSYGYVLTEGVAIDIQRGVLQPLNVNSPLFYCGCHEKHTGGRYLIARCNGSVKLGPRRDLVVPLR